MQVNEYAYIATQTTTTVCPKPSVLHSIVVGETAAGTITVQDDGATVAVLKASIAEDTYIFDIAIKGVLTVVTAAASKLTVCYRPS